jgi:hypothetical protein
MTTFAAFDATAMISVVRVSCRPRRKPAPARVMSRAGAPSTLMRRYVAAKGWTARDAPMTSTIAGASTTPNTASVSPRPVASHKLSTPSSAAARRLAAPTWRATEPVVEYARKLKIANVAVSTVPAIARPASGLVPRCPTIAVSTRM